MGNAINVGWLSGRAESLWGLLSDSLDLSPSLLFTDWVILGQCHDFSEPQLPHLENGDMIIPNSQDLGGAKGDNNMKVLYKPQGIKCIHVFNLLIISISCCLFDCYSIFS